MKNKIISILLSLAFVTNVRSIPFDWDVVNDQNKREYQEDRYTYTPIMDPNNRKEGDFFGIYDGHGGDKVSTLLANELHTYFALECSFEENDNRARYPGVITEKSRFEYAFHVMEEKALESYNDDGSTAVVAYIDNKNILHVAWVGDSRLVVECNGEVGFATEDHKPDRPDEKKRIEKDGGRVRMDGVPRINGLAVSRSIGDRKLKESVGWLGYVIAKPEYAQYQLSKHNEYIILASDGLWDVVSNEKAVALVKEIFKDGKSCNVAANTLKEEAVNRGSGDNITVMVIQCDWSKENK